MRQTTHTPVEFTTNNAQGCSPTAASAMNVELQQKVELLAAKDSIIDEMRCKEAHDMQEFRQETQQTMQAQARRISELTQKLHESERQNTDAATLTTNVRKYKALSQELDLQVVQLEEDLKACKSQVASLASQQVQLEAEVSEAAVEHRATSLALQRCKADVSRLQGEVESHRNLEATLRLDFQQLTAQYSTNVDLVQELQAQNKRLKEELTSTEDIKVSQECKMVDTWAKKLQEALADHHNQQTLLEEWSSARAQILMDQLQSTLASVKSAEEHNMRNSDLEWATKFSAQKLEHAKHLEDIRGEYEQKRTDMQQEHDHSLVELKQQYDKQLESQHDHRLQEISSEAQIRMDTTQQLFDRRITEIDSYYTCRVKSLQGEYDTRAQQLERWFNDTVNEEKALREKMVHETETQMAKCRLECDNKLEEWKVERETERELAEHKAQETELNYNEKIEQLREATISREVEFANELKKITTGYQSNVEEMRTSMLNQIEADTAAFQKRLNDVEQQHRIRENELLDTIKQLETDLTNQVAQRGNELNVLLEDTLVRLEGVSTAREERLEKRASAAETRLLTLTELFDEKTELLEERHLARERCLIEFAEALQVELERRTSQVTEQSRRLQEETAQVAEEKEQLLEQQLQQQLDQERQNLKEHYSAETVKAQTIVQEQAIDIHKLQKEVSRYTTDNAYLEGEIKRLKIELDDEHKLREGEESESRKRTMQITADYEKLMRCVKEESTRRERVQQEDLDTKLHTVAKEKDDVAAQNVQLLKDLALVQADKEAKDLKFQALEEAYQKTKILKEESERKIGQLQDEITKLNQQKEEASSKVCQYQENMINVKQHCEESDGRNRHLQQDIQRLKEQCEEKSKQCEDSETKNRQLQHDLHNLKQHCEECETRNRKLQHEVNTLKQRCEDSEGHNRQLQQEGNALKQQYEEKSRQYDESESTNRQLQQDIHTLKHMQEDIEQTTEKLQEELTRFKQETTDSNHQQQQMQREINGLLQEKQGSESERQTMQVTIEHLQRELAVLKEKMKIELEEAQERLELTMDMLDFLGDNKLGALACIHDATIDQYRDWIKRARSDARQQKLYPYLGLEIAEEVPLQEHVYTGVRVSTVRDQGPAWLAGIEPGDTIRQVQVLHKSHIQDLYDFRVAVEKVRHGDVLHFHLSRGELSTSFVKELVVQASEVDVHKPPFRRRRPNNTSPGGSSADGRSRSPSLMGQSPSFNLNLSRSSPCVSPTMHFATKHNMDYPTFASTVSSGWPAPSSPTASTISSSGSVPGVSPIHHSAPFEGQRCQSPQHH